jgi:hypothetical protein
MSKLFKFDETTLSYVEVSENKKDINLKLIGLLIIGFTILSVLVYHLVIIDNYNRGITQVNEDYLPIGGLQWKDSVFREYEVRARIYLNQDKFKGTPITSGMLSLAAYNAYDSTGIILPVELALAQAQFESSMGRLGRSPINNPYNVGEYDDRTVIWFDNTFSGVQAYYYLMCRNYLKCKSINILFKNFTNCDGNRYASDKNYEEKITSQYYLIKGYINNTLVSGFCD